MSQQDPKQMLREGIEAAREGDRKKARELFEKVVELEENNEKGWMWLASVMDSDEERRICFANVLQINPDNERAQKEMAKIEARMNKTKADEEVVPGVSRRQLTLYVGIAAALVVVVVAIVALVVVSRNIEEARITGEATAAAQQATDLVSTQAAIAQAGTETAVALASPTPTERPTVNAPTLPPTWTPIPEAGVVVQATPLPQPVGLPGILVGWRGRDFGGRGFYQAVYYRLDGGGEFTPISDDTREVTINPADGTRVAYTRFFSAGLTFGIELINLNGTQPESLNLRWQGTTEQIIEQQMSSFSRDGTKLIFASVDANTSTRQIFYADLTAEPGAGVLVRLTQDDADYSYPVLSPDGTRLAVVRNDIFGASPGADIYILDFAARTVVAQLTNNGSEYTESQLQWVNDTQLAYAFASGNDPDTHDIAIVDAGAPGALPNLPGRDPEADDIYPVFSPDGAHMAFVSDRSGQYDIYIINIATQEIFQLTNTPEPDYLGAWYVAP